MAQLCFRLAVASLFLIGLSACKIYINADEYGMQGYDHQQRGAYPPFKEAQTPPDSVVLAYEVLAADLQQPSATGRYQWILPHCNVCVIYPQTLDQWVPFMDSVRQTERVDFRFVVSCYNRELLREYRSWLDEHSWHDPIFVLRNAHYGNRRSRKEKQFLQELAGPQADTRYAPVVHVLLDPSGRCVYFAREDEDPKNADTKPRATIEADIRHLIAG